MHDEFTDVFFLGIGYFEGPFSLQVKEGSKLYQAPLRCVACKLQKQFKEELVLVQHLEIIVHLGVDEAAERSNSFVLVSKPKGKMRLYVDPARLN